MSPQYRSKSFALLLALLGAACASTPEKLAPHQPILDRPDDPIGKFLADADAAIARWCRLSLTANTTEERREQRLLEQVLNDRTSKRRPDLVRELESGPPINRIRAAAALGFTHAVEAQSPLLNALSDPLADVQHNALLGLAILARADTPLEPICRLCEFSPDAETRGQAAFALRSIVNAGGAADCAATTARRGLIDSEAFVRSQCALTLGLLGDEPSAPALCDLLHDESQHAASAAIEALLLLVDAKPGQKGVAGRALLDLHTGSKEPLKGLAMQALVRISDVNYGEDLGRWTEWAERLP